VIGTKKVSFINFIAIFHICKPRSQSRVNDLREWPVWIVSMGMFHNIKIGVQSFNYTLCPPHSNGGPRARFDPLSYHSLKILKMYKYILLLNNKHFFEIRKLLHIKNNKKIKYNKVNDASGEYCSRNIRSLALNYIQIS